MGKKIMERYKGDLESELKDGNRNIKEYNYLGNLLYEGEYKDGQRWNGKIYNCKGDIVLELKDGRGNGKEYDFWNNLVYEGDFVYGIRHGTGKEFKVGKKIYEGEYYKGKKYGKGKEYNNFGRLIFKGEFNDEKYENGKLFEYYKDQLLFEADYSTSWCPRKICIEIKNRKIILIIV